ncbi:MAG: sasA 15, partial [Verrucomicrobiales bacterium]|nr:sasA 15 [Verrucomicrobiales bacterium]
KADSTPKNLIDLIRNVLANPNPAAAASPTVSSSASSGSMTSPGAPALESTADESFLVTKPVEADAGFQAGVRKNFAETAPAALAYIRQTLMAYSKTEDQTDKLTHLNELYRKVHSLAESAGVAGMKQVSIMGSALEALLKEVCEKPKTINPSVLRTIASAIDFLGQLFTASMSGEWEFEQPHILVLDDEIISRRAVIYALEKIKLRGLSVADPNIALTLLQDNKFDLIFLDVDLGSMSGFDVCTLLRTFPNHAKTPVIFVTGASDFASRAKSTLSGGTDLIAKPFLFMELAVKALTHILKKKTPPPQMG